MKLYQRRVLSVIIMLGFFIPAGCALLQRGSRAEFNTLASVGYMADSAMSAYDAGIVRGIIPTNNLPKVNNYYNDFQAGYRQALATAQGGSNTIAPASLVAKEQTLLNAIGGGK